MNNWKIWCYPISRFCQVDHTKVSTKTSVHVNHAYVSMVVESPGCITPQGLTANYFHSPTPNLAPLGGWHPLRWKSTQRAVDHNRGPRQHSQPAAWMGVVANVYCLHQVLLYPVYMNFMMFIVSISFDFFFLRITKVMMICIISFRDYWGCDDCCVDFYVHDCCDVHQIVDHDHYDSDDAYDEYLNLVGW